VGSNALDGIDRSGRDRYVVLVCYGLLNRWEVSLSVTIICIGVFLLASDAEQGVRH